MNIAVHGFYLLSVDEIEIGSQAHLTIDDKLEESSQMLTATADETSTREQSGGRSTRPRRLRQLDILRALAILLVLAAHCGIEPATVGPFAPLLRRLEDVGWIGVDCFFVLSGFLIGGLLFAEIRSTGAFDFKRFLVRRTFKIWPQYYSYLAFMFVAGVLFFGYLPMARLRMSLFALIHLQNYSRRWESHIWSLAVEEHFYVLLPLTLFILVAVYGSRCRSGLPRFFVGGLITMGVVLAGRVALGLLPFNAQLHYFGTHARLDSLLGGVMIAYVSAYHPGRWNALLNRPGAALLVAGLLLAPLVLMFPNRDEWFTRTVGYTLLYLGFGCLLIFCMGASQLPAVTIWLEGRLAGFLAWIGINSYGTYLWHQDLIINPVRRFLHPHLSGCPGFVEFFVEASLIVGGSLLVGALSTRWIERPMLTLREHLFPARSLKTV